MSESTAVAQRLHGFMTLGQIISVMNLTDTRQETVAVLPHVLNGEYDDCLLAALTTLPGIDPVQRLTRLKDEIRAFIGQIFVEAAAQDEADKQEQLKKVQEELRTHSAPHPEGTVSELAKKFGVSKSEIRRRKLDGTLQELTGSKT